MRDPRRAYRVVDAFEQELADYCGSEYAVTVDSCTNAIFLALRQQRYLREREVWMPRRTYVGVLQAALNAGYDVDWHDDPWMQYGSYWIAPTVVIDSARRIAPLMYAGRSLTCLSFHAAKQLPLGRGGAILTDSSDTVEWLQRARADGRRPGDGAPYATQPGHHMYMPPDTAARGLWILSRWNDSGFVPAPLHPDDYPDLSALDFSSSQNRAPSNSGPRSPERTIEWPLPPWRLR